LAASQHGANLGDAPFRFLLQEGKEQILFGPEMRVERAARMSRGGGHFFNPRGLETIPGENAPRRIQ
jgi:hypothetical protein